MFQLINEYIGRAGILSMGDKKDSAMWSWATVQEQITNIEKKLEILGAVNLSKISDGARVLMSGAAGPVEIIYDHDLVSPAGDSKREKITVVLCHQPTMPHNTLVPTIVIRESRGLGDEHNRTDVELCIADSNEKGYTVTNSAPSGPRRGSHDGSPIHVDSPIQHYIDGLSLP